MIKFLYPTLLGLSLTACGVKNSIPGATHSAFLSSSGVPVNSHIARLPFQHSWRDPAVQIDQYKNIVVRPVTTRYLPAAQWINSKSPWIPTQRSFLRNSNKLATFWDASLKRSFSSPVCSYYLKQNPSEPKTLILEVALTEITFGRPDSTPIIAPPLVAFEARVTDAATGKIVATAADLRTDRLELRTLTKATLAAGNREICTQWSEQLMQATNRELFAKVKGSWFLGF